MAVAGKRARQVQRRRQPIAPQRRGGGARLEHRDLQAALQRHALLAAQPGEQIPVGGAAAQEHVLPVVQQQPIALERVRRSSEPASHLHERHLRARIRAVEGGRDPCKAAAYHHHLPCCAQLSRPTAPTLAGRRRLLRISLASMLVTAIQAFSHPGSAMRSASARSGRACTRSSSLR